MSTTRRRTKTKAATKSIDEQQALMDRRRLSRMRLLLRQVRASAHAVVRARALADRELAALAMYLKAYIPEPVKSNHPEA